MKDSTRLLIKPKRSFHVDRAERNRKYEYRSFVKRDAWAKPRAKQIHGNIIVSRSSPQWTKWNKKIALLALLMCLSVRCYDEANFEMHVLSRYIAWAAIVPLMWCIFFTLYADRLHCRECKSTKVPKRTLVELKLLISSWMRYAHSRYELFSFHSRIRDENHSCTILLMP